MIFLFLCLFNDIVVVNYCVRRISSLPQLPMTRTEETSLLEEGSSDSDHGEGSEGEEEGEEEEEERGGGKGGKKRRPDRDEELIDL